VSIGVYFGDEPDQGYPTFLMSYCAACPNKWGYHADHDGNRTFTIRYNPNSERWTWYVDGKPVLQERKQAVGMANAGIMAVGGSSWDDRNGIGFFSHEKLYVMVQGQGSIMFIPSSTAYLLQHCNGGYYSHFNYANSGAIVTIGDLLGPEQRCR
jgi:hypothetical protein